MEDYVPVDISKKLKEKGFPQGNKNDITEKYYTIADYIKAAVMLANNEDVKWYCPTISQVLKWLRDEKEIDIVIEPIFFYDDNYDRTRNYNCVIFAPQLNNPKHCVYYDKWEESAIAGIEYTLENLI